MLQDSDWELGREQLSVRPAIPCETPIAPDNCKNVSDSDRTSNCLRRNDSVLDNRVPELPCDHFTSEEYRSGSSRFWADVPHETFTVAAKKKRKRNSLCADSSVANKKIPKHKQTKKRKKKHKGYLVSNL